MTKNQALELAMLLSALESWGFSTASRIPDYLHERLSEAVGMLEKEILDERP